MGFDLSSRQNNASNFEFNVSPLFPLKKCVHRVTVAAFHSIAISLPYHTTYDQYNYDDGNIDDL